MATLSNIITPTNIVTISGVDTLTNKTINAANNTISNIDLATDVTGTLAQTHLANTSFTVNGVEIELGGTDTVTSNAETLTGTSLNSSVVGSSLTSVGTLSTLVVSGNVTGSYILGNGSSLTSLTGANVTGAVAFAGTANAVAGANVSGAVALATTATSAGSANAVAGANVSGTVANATFSTGANLSAYANIVTDAAQPNITSLGTLSSLTTNGLTVEGLMTANANAQFNGDVFFTGNVTLPGTINQISGNSGSFFGNSVTGFGALYAGLPAGYTLLAQEVMQYASSFDGYTQLSFTNINSGSQATGDMVVTADNGNDDTNFVTLGIAGSGYDGAVAGANNALGTSLFADDGYVYSQGNTTANTGGNLVLGSNQPNKVVKIIAGGSNTANISVIISAPGTATTNTTTGTLTVAGGIGLTGNLAANSIIGTRVVPRATSIASSVTPTPNADTTDQYEVTALASAATFGIPTGTPTAGQKLTIRIKDNGTSQTLAWNAIYRAIGLILPTATVANKLIYVGCIYNTNDTKWDVVAVSEES
jgi:hypothetical protein